FQALAAPFRLYWDGPVNPLAEEIPELRALNEPDLEDREARQRILADPDYQARFCAMWMHGKQGGLAGLKRKMRAEQMAFDRDMKNMVFHSGCPADWVGETFEDVFKRYQVSFAMPDVIRSDDERAAFEALPAIASTPDIGEPYFVLGLFQLYDTDLRWWTISANRDMEVVRKLLNDPQIFPGFNDSGAHLTNMAFYDGNLRCLQMAQGEGMERVAAQVKRLTRDPADFIGIDAGRIEIGSIADIAIIDPEALKAYDSDAGLQFIHRDVFDHEQLVNRSDGVVTHVVVGGGIVWADGGFTSAHGKQKLGRALRHRDAGAASQEQAIAAE
ncbi:MAG: amidohydrolase family protein, partial [Caulobacterales bacterium]|uniref:amidohydrolase family protein n=1 Tax=Glycocaulis sp. TaxID=1969725 RepID=UPI003FA05748